MFFAVLKYIALIIVDIAVTFLNFPLAPIAVLFASEDGWLPRWLWWFQTPDNSLDGDGGWKELHRWWKDDADVETNKFKRYINRVLWLYRNSAYGFAIDVMGARIEEGFKFEIEGSPKVSNRPLYEGSVFRKVTNPSGSVYWQWYYVKAWSETRCLRINLGWKLWGDLKAGENRQFTFSPNPAMGLIRQ